MTANLWLEAQAQTNPVITTVLGNGGIAYFTVPVIPVAAAGATGAVGVTPNFVVSKILNVQCSKLSMCTPRKHTGEWKYN
jgi:hypothetical protein